MRRLKMRLSAAWRVLFGGGFVLYSREKVVDGVASDKVCLVDVTTDMCAHCIGYLLDKSDEAMDMESAVDEAKNIINGML